jgi:hypothetical protein
LAAHKSIIALEKTIKEADDWLKKMMANIKKIKNKKEGKTLFESGRVRHDKAHEAGQHLILKEKAHAASAEGKKAIALKLKLTKDWGIFRKTLEDAIKKAPAP